MNVQGMLEHNRQKSVKYLEEFKTLIQKSEKGSEREKELLRQYERYAGLYVYRFVLPDAKERLSKINSYGAMLFNQEILEMKEYLETLQKEGDE